MLLRKTGKWSLIVSAGLSISALLVIMLVLLIVPTFYVKGLYDESDADIENDYDSLIREIRLEVKKSYQKTCKEGLEIAEALSDAYSCSENRENVMEVRYVNIDMEETELPLLVANDMIATYNATINFVSNANEIIDKIRKESKKTFLKDVREYCRNLFYVYAVTEEKVEFKQISDDDFYYETMYSIAIGKSESVFLNSQINEVTALYSAQQNVSSTTAAVDFHLLKEGYVQALNEMSGLGSSYPFTRERIVRNFVSTHSDAELRQYHWSRKKALDIGGYSCFYGVQPDGTVHKGLDIAISEGTVLEAINEGIVVQSDFDPDRRNTYRERINSAGNVLVIYYGTYEGNYVFYLYAHLSQNDVKTGDVVCEKQKIGRTGNTGYSTGPHLHWEVVFMNMQSQTIITVDPLAYCR